MTRIPKPAFHGSHARLRVGVSVVLLATAWAGFAAGAEAPMPANPPHGDSQGHDQDDSAARSPARGENRTQAAPPTGSHPGLRNRNAGKTPAPALSHWRIVTAVVPQGVVAHAPTIGSAAVVFETDDGTQRVPLADVVSVEPEPPAAPQPSEACILLAGGERIASSPRQLVDDVLVVPHAAAPGGRWRVPLQYVHAVVLRAPIAARVVDELFARLDGLRTRDDQAWLLSGLPVRGELTEWQDSVLSFATDLGNVRVRQAATRALLLAADLSVPVPVPRGAYGLLLLRDGSRLRVRDLRADGTVWKATTSWGEPCSVRSDEVLRVRFFGGRAEYLTAVLCLSVRRDGYWPALFRHERSPGPRLDAERAWLLPGASREESLSGQPIETAAGEGRAATVWPVWQNRNARGWPLRSRAAVYAMGWGVLGAATLEFALPDGARRFVARCGLDRTCAPGSSVRFVVETSGGKVLWESDVLREAGQERLAVVDLPEMTSRLILRTDHADRGDIADFANWYAPYVLRADQQSR